MFFDPASPTSKDFSHIYRYMSKEKCTEQTHAPLTILLMTCLGASLHSPAQARTDATLNSSSPKTVIACF